MILLCCNSIGLCVVYGGCSLQLKLQYAVQNDVELALLSGCLACTSVFFLCQIGTNLKILSLFTLHASCEPRFLDWVFSCVISTTMCVGMCKYFLSFLCVSIWVGSYPV